MAHEKEKKTIIFGDILCPQSSLVESQNIGFLSVYEHGLEDYDPVIIATGSLSAMKSRKERDEQTIIREREITLALKNGAHVCILCNDPDDPLFLQLLSRNSIHFNRSQQHISKLSIRRSEFSTCLNNYGTAFGIFSGLEDFDYIISTVEKSYMFTLLQEKIKLYNNEFVTGFSRKKDNGLITFLPFFIPQTLIQYDQKIWDTINNLKNCLNTFRTNVTTLSVIWKKEQELETEISRIQGQLNEKQTLLEKQQRLKSLLLAKHGELRDIASEALKEIGFDTLKDERDEILWIIDGSGKKGQICGVKTKEENITIDDLINFERQRRDLGRDETFPSLFIVQTYSNTVTESEKDQSISSIIIQRAIQSRIWITRTLDLFKVLDMSRDQKQIFVNKVTQSGGGWIKSQKVQALSS